MTKLRRKQQRIKQKKLSTFSSNCSLKKVVFERFNEDLSHFQFKAEFLSYCSSHGLEFENSYTLATLNNTYKNNVKINNASQTCQDVPGLLKILTMEDERN